MTTGLMAERDIQIVRETTHGTTPGTPAWRRLFGTATLTQEAMRHRPMDNTRRLAQYERSVVVSHGSTIRFQGDASYEQLLDFLAMTLRGGRTATNGAGSGGGAADFSGTKIWDFTPNQTADNDQDSYTFQIGDNVQVWNIPYVQCNSLTIGLATSQVATLSADMFGRLGEKSSARGTGVSPSDTAFNEIISEACKIYVADSWADVRNESPGSPREELDATLISANIMINSGLVPARYLDGLDASGRANFSRTIENRRSHSIDMDLIVDATTISEIYDRWLSGGTKAIRLEMEDAGKIVAAAGDVKANHRLLTIDMFGQFDDQMTIYDERDGENIIRPRLTSFSDQSGNELSIKIQNARTGLDVI